MKLKILEIIKNFCYGKKNETEEKTKQDESDDFEKIFERELRRQISGESDGMR